MPFKPLAPFFGFERSIVFQRVPAWNEMVNGPDDAKLADPRRSRRGATAPATDWDAPHPLHHSPGSTARTRCCFAISETGAGPLDSRSPTTPTQSGLHISDALAEWVLANGIRSIMVGTPEELAEDDIVAALREPRTLTNINDSGAHLQLFSGAGEHLYLLTHYVRDAGSCSASRRRCTCSPAAPRRSSASPTGV